MSEPAASYPAPRQTVFKRRRRNNFTVLGNAVLFDGRLELEEMAAIVKLLAKPHDWQVHPGALRKEWGVGREKFYRIINKLIKLGYVTRGEMIQDAWGRFTACEYIVTDEPEAPPAEIDDPADTSGFDNVEEDAAGESGPAADGAKPENVIGVATVPHAGFRDAGEPHTANQHAEKELRDIQKKLPPLPPGLSGQQPSGEPTAGAVGAEPAQASDSARPPDTAAPPLPNHRGPAIAPRGPSEPGRSAPNGPVDPKAAPMFETFVAAYRPEPHMSIEGAKRRWMRLKEQQQIDAVKYLADFRADRDKRGWKMPDMRRYLMDQHWVPYSKAATIAAETVTIKRGSAQWYRWREYFEATNPRRLAWFDTRDVWYERREWPPALPPKEHRHTAPAPSADQPNEENHGT
jgi:hypothetical protein